MYEQRQKKYRQTKYRVGNVEEYVGKMIALVKESARAGHLTSDELLLVVNGLSSWFT